MSENESNLDRLATLIREALAAQASASWQAARAYGQDGAAALEADAASDAAAAKTVELWTAFYQHGGDYGAALIERDALRGAAAAHTVLLAKIDQVLPAKAGA
jgi:hypothetical protein